MACSYRTGFLWPLLLAIYACIVDLQPCHAENGDSTSYNVRHYTDEDGLPQNSIKAIRQDENGFIWLATEDGLTRFDGNSFFTYNTANTGITSNRFLNIRNSLYDGQLGACNINEEFVRIADGKATADKAYSCYNKELLSLLAAQGFLPRFSMTSGPERLFPCGKNSFYIFLDKNVYNFKDNRQVFKIAYDADGNEPWRFFMIAGTLYHCNKNGAVYAFKNNGLQKINITGDIVRNDYYAHKINQLHSFANNGGNAVLLQLHNALYLAEEQKDGSLLTHLVVSNFDFDDMRVSCAFYDRAHELVFLGSVTNGLYVLRKKRFRTLTIGDDEINNDYYAMSAYDSNAVVTSQGNLIGNVRPLQHVFGPGYFNEYTILTDREGYIWQARDSLARYTHDFRTAHKWRIPGSDIIVIYQAPTGTVWVGTRTGKILGIDPATLRPAVALPVIVRGLSYILQEDRNTMWVGSSVGLYRLRLDDMHVDTISGLKGKYVRSLYLSAPGQLWITTYGSGFYLYMNGRLTDFPEDNEHFLNAAHCIIEDRRGYFWITANKGLFQVAKNDLLAYAASKQQDVFYLYYGKSNGFNTNEFNGGCEPCGVRLASDYIALPSLHGVVWFSAAGFKEDLPDKNVFIDRLTLNDKEIPVTDHLELDQHNVQLNIAVSTPYFGDRRNVHMYYQLAEDDKKQVYVPLPANGIVSLQNLSYGKYTLTICKVNGFGKDNFARKIITLTVLPYWYQTGWFYTSVVLLFLALVYLFISLRTRFLINKNRMLEIIIRKRTQNLEQALRSLETSQSAQEKQTYIQERLVAAISHDIRTPLKYLSFTNRKLHQMLQLHEADNEMLEISKSAADAATRMHRYLGNLLQYVKTSLKKGDIKADVFNLYDLVNEHIAMFADVAQLNKTKITNEVIAEQELFTNRQLLAIILHNILDNAVKNTFYGVINVSAAAIENVTTITITDTGGGLPAALKDWVNNAGNNFDPADGGTNTSVNAGMGLFIVKELSALIKAQLYITSDDTGTAVHITLNL